MLPRSKFCIHLILNNEILLHVMCLLFQELVGFNFIGEISHFATDYQMAFPEICVN